MQLNFFGDDFFLDRRFNIRVKGYALLDSKILTENDLAEYLYRVLQNRDFQHLNGKFAAILEIQNEIWILSDLIRSIPLFYVKNGQQLLVAYRAMKLKEGIPGFELNTNQIKYFETVGYCLGDETLINHVKQTQAAQWIRISEKAIEKHEYFRFPTDIFPISKVDAQNELRQLLYTIFQDYRHLLKSKIIVLPLSSGLDSRLIAFMLKELGFKNVLCFTFGRRNSHELAKSRKVAEMLGFEWLFIDYELPENTYFDDELFRYLEFASNAASMPYLQDYFAIRYLKNKQIIDKNCIFLPGHSADFLAGSHLRPWMNPNSRFFELEQFITEQNSFFCSESTILQSFLKENNDVFAEAWQFAEYYDYTERQTKFIVNSLSVLDFFGFDYLLPFWDSRLISFFATLPYEYRLYKILYDDALQQLFSKNGLWFPDDKKLKPENFRFRKLRKWLQPYLPNAYQRKKQKAADWMNYEFLTREMRNELLEKKLIKNKVLPYNYILSLWYLEFLKSKY